MLLDAMVFAIFILALVWPSSGFALGPCGPPSGSFNGFWGGGLIQVSERIGGVPLLVATRFSYKEIRESPCEGGTPLFPPGVGEASVSVGVPIFNRRRGGWLLQIAAKGQGSQKPNAPVSGQITGAPATTGHLNIWETAIPLIQLTGAASAAIIPQGQSFPLSIAYLGGVRLYPLYGRHAQTNLGLTLGGSNAAINFVPSMGIRASDLSLWNHKIALGFEMRSPLSLLPGPTPVSWRFWGALTIAVDEIDETTKDRSHVATPPRPGVDLVHSPAEAAPPAQTAWEITL